MSKEKKKWSERFPGLEVSEPEEQRERQRSYFRSLTPYQRLQELHRLIRNTYPREAKGFEKRIHIDHPK